MSAHTMHLSTSIWGPDASVFNPDRWLQPGGKDMDQYFVPFSKGTRSCIGMKYAPTCRYYLYYIYFQPFQAILLICECVLNE